MRSYPGWTRFLGPVGEAGYKSGSRAAENACADRVDRDLPSTRLLAGSHLAAICFGSSTAALKAMMAQDVAALERN
jgi:hypothetical protein